MRIAAIIGFLLVTLAAFAQTTTTYRLQPDDILRVQVLDEQQVNAICPVGNDGNITAPFVGVVRAEGKTVTELTAELVKLYQEKLRIREPKVAVTVEKFRDLKASVVDMVNRPGVFDIRQTDTVIDLLSYGGGPILSGERRADLRRATLRRKGSREIIPIDLNALLRYGDMSQNYTLQDGDILTIPEDRFSQISVFGQVQRPGSFPFHDGMTLSDALSLGAGEIPYRGSLSKVVVSRANPARPGEYVQIVANFKNYLVKGDSTQNVRLQAGDLVYVPESKDPDLNRLNQIVSALANGFYILDRFGLGILPRRGF